MIATRPHNDSAAKPDSLLERTAGKRHLGLIITGDDELAVELGDLLVSLGHDHVRTETQEEALSTIAAGQFCYILLDLELKANASSRKARIETGLSLLSRLRSRYPETTKRIKFRTQILALGDADRIDQSIVKVMQLGANELLVKPLGENQPSVYDKLITALRHSGRLSHSRCTVTQATRAAEGTVVYDATSSRYSNAVYFPATDHEYERIKAESTLLIDLRQRRVFYRGHEIHTEPTRGCAHLQKQPLAVLAILAMRHAEQVDETKLNELIYEIGLLDDNVGTNLRGIKRRIVQPFCDALAAEKITQRELKGLVRVIRGMRKIVLHVPGSVRVIGLPKQVGRF